MDTRLLSLEHSDHFIRFRMFRSVDLLQLTSTHNYHNHRPPHSTSCPSARTVFARVGGCKQPPAQVAEGDTTMCVSGVSALVSAWKSTTIASCNWWQPSPVQVEWLHLADADLCTLCPDLCTLRLWCFHL